MRRVVAPTIFTVALLAVPGAAQAHVTLQPDSAPAGGFTRLDVRVPSERDDVGTVKVDVRMPPGFVFASYEPIPGWSVRVVKQKLDKPVETDDGEVTEQVSRITWTGNPEQGGIIEPGQFQDFGLSVGIPDGDPGSKLTFKAVQTYQGGEVVRWIGPADAEEPAPTVTLTAADGEDGHDTADAAAGEPTNTNAAATSTSDDDGSDTLSIVALIVGALGLAAGVAGLAVARRARV